MVAKPINQKPNSKHSQPGTSLHSLLTAKEVSALAALGIDTLESALRLAPRRYVIPGLLTELDQIQAGEAASVIATVLAVNSRRMKNRYGHLLEVMISDEAGSQLNLTFFIFKEHLLRWHSSRLQVGEKILVSGTVGFYNGQAQITHPSYILLSQSSEAEIKTALSPQAVYPLRAGVTQKIMRKIYGKLLEAVLPARPASEPSAVSEMRPAKKHIVLPEVIPHSIRQSNKLPGLLAAIKMLHLPETEAQVQSARKYFSYEEAFILQSIFARRRSLDAADSAPELTDSKALLKQLDQVFPFELTESQIMIGEQIAERIAQPHPSSILVQGDVGSGKTVVALRAMTLAVSSGYQTALLAPTEVLARQHYESIGKILQAMGESAPKLTLLLGSQKTAQRRQALLEIVTGEGQIVVGTHALLSENVEFFQLGLVVVDEQHRFGVDHRRQLREKGKSHINQFRPHSIVMTATPIPRTAALALVGDVDTLQLGQRDRAGAAIQSFVVSSSDPAWWQRMWERTAEEIHAGRQAFIVCPRIFETDEAETDSGDLLGAMPSAETEYWVEASPQVLKMHSVEATYSWLSQYSTFQGIKIAALHSKQSTEEKQQVMADFVAGKIQLLVSTTVIEVGVDVPNASIMCVLNAERFGLAQLHQLRGRIGRGEHASIAFFATEYPKNHPGFNALQSVAATQDGFALAELDLARRGSGDISGYVQSGPAASLKFLNLQQDAELLQQAREDAFTIEALSKMGSDQAPTELEQIALDQAIAAKVEGGIEKVERS